MLDDILKKEIIQLLETKRPEEIRRTVSALYCGYHRMVSHPLKNVSHLRSFMQLAKDGTITLDLDNVVETNHIFCQTNGLFIIQLEV